MRLPVALRRLAYRCVHALLRVWWWLVRPSLHGVKCVLTHGDEVLLVRHTYGNRRWDLPGGRVRRHERPADTAPREMREELGIPIDVWVSLGELVVRMYHRHDTLHIFHASVSAQRLTLNRAELERAAWFPRDALPADRGPYVAAILARLS